jgi:DNA-binding transcriptional regulator LsrR (DeoR family)
MIDRYHSGITAKQVAEKFGISLRSVKRLLQAMIDLYKSGATAEQVAEVFGIGLTSAKRVLREHGIRKRAAAGSIERQRRLS